jgi:hypothetical protein
MVIYSENKSKQQILHKDLLIQFWNYFLEDDSVKGGNKIKREALKANAQSGLKSQQERLRKLKEYSQFILESPKETVEKRQDFDRLKKTLHRANAEINKKCFVCLSQAHCRHHIIQLQHGGMNHKKNIVSLCNFCHAKIHPWM